MGKNPTDTTNDELVEMHKRARVRKKRKLIITLVIILVAVTAAVIVGVTMLRKKVNEQVNSASGNEVESAEVTIGSISTTVSGSGTLEAEDVETLEILSTLEIVDYYVEAGDSV